MDLFRPEALKEKQHHNFISMLAEEGNYARLVLQDWAEGFVDRDGKFVYEFQTTFNSSFWELYLFECIKKLGGKVDFSYSSPDFVFELDGQSVCLEAVIANNAKGAPEEWEKDLDLVRQGKVDLKEVVNVSTIRLANAIDNKCKKYQKSYAKLEHVKGRPFVIAVAPFEQPFFFFQNMEAIYRVLYGYDRPIYEDFPERNERIVYQDIFMETIKKPNGADIPLGFFNNPDVKDVSAVIFSTTATYGKLRALSRDPGMIFFSVLRYNADELEPIQGVIPKPLHHETLFDGLHIFHNPYAEHPFNMESLYAQEDIAHHDFDPTEQQIINSVPDGHLIQRTVVKMNFRNRNV